MLAAPRVPPALLYEMRGIWELTAGVGVFGVGKTPQASGSNGGSDLCRQLRRSDHYAHRDTKSRAGQRGVAASKVDVVPNFYEGAIEAADVSTFADGLKHQLADGG